MDSRGTSEDEVTRKAGGIMPTAKIFPPGSVMSPWKHALMICGWVLFLSQVAAMATVVGYHLNMLDPKWSFFVNAWVPLSAARITVMIFVVLMVDWMFPGYAISAILDIDRDSSSEDKRTAMWFLLGIAALTAWCMRGSLGGGE